MCCNYGPLLLALSVLGLGCQAGAYFYFAEFVKGELRLYFAQHSIQWGYDDTYQDFAYLIALGVLSWIMVIGYITLLATCGWPGRSGSWRIISAILLSSIIIAIITLGSLLAKQSFSLYAYLVKHGRRDLAQHCFDLAATILFGLPFSLLVYPYMVTILGFGDRFPLSLRQRPW